MKHVFVETNFLISVLRPFPTRTALRLLARQASGELCLHVPWVALSEVRRTLVHVIREDFDYHSNMLRHAALELQRGRLPKEGMGFAQSLATYAEELQKTAFQHIHQDVANISTQLSVILPTEAVVQKTLSVFAVKQLPPFDEMILGAVLTKAHELHAQGESNLWFCNLNSRDFSPERNPLAQLANEYQLCGLQYLDSFEVP